MRGPMVMPGYWRRPEATADTITPDRWLRTGDIGRMEGGRLYLSSRKRDLIFRGGENVYPVEIEKRIEDHPDVEECAVIGVDDPELGQTVKAVIVAAAGSHDRRRVRAGVVRGGARVLQGARALGGARGIAAAQRGGQDPEGRVARRAAPTPDSSRSRQMPLDLRTLVAPEHTALVLQEVQNGVVGSPSALPALADAAAAVDLIGNCARLARGGARASA